MLKGNPSSGHYENPFSLESVDNLTTHLQKFISSFIEPKHILFSSGDCLPLNTQQMIRNCPKLGDDHSTYQFILFSLSSCISFLPVMKYEVNFSINFIHSIVLILIFFFDQINIVLIEYWQNSLKINLCCL